MDPSNGNTPKRKHLGLWMCTALVVGNMIGSGLFMLPASLAAFGSISLLAWLFTGIGAMLLAGVFFRLSRRSPGVGGPYAFGRQVFGDFTGFVVAWGYWISIWSGNAAIAVALVSYLSVFWPALDSNPWLAVAMALANIWFLTAINAIGIRQAGWAQLISTALKLIPLLAIAALGLFYFDINNLKPLVRETTTPISAITAAASLTLFAFMGLESATVPADNVDNPKSTIPRATMLGTMLTGLIYIICTVAVMGVIKQNILMKSSAPFADAAAVMFGSWARLAVAAGAAISCFGALNGWILVQAQVPRAVARDGLFPPFFARLSKRGTPVMGLVFSSCLVSVLMIMNFAKGMIEKFNFIILLATLTCLLPYAVAALAEMVHIFRERETVSPARFVRLLVMVMMAFAYSIWTIIGSGPEIMMWGAILIAAGIPVFLWYKKKQG
jgi:APA family basic amino acid/polyamine antiporter